MNLEQSDSFKEQIEKNTKKRRGVMLSIALCACLIAFLFIMIKILQYQDSITEKLFLDGKQISIPKGLYTEIEGKTYLNLKQLSDILGYSYTKGEYNKFNENEDSAYLQNDFEIVAVTAEKSQYEKYLGKLANEVLLAEIPITMKSEPNYYEVFDVKESPVKLVDGSLYVALDNVPEMFNVQIEWEQYRKKIYSLEYVIEKSKAVIAKLEYNQISGYYENLRALLYGYAIVGNGSTEEGKEKESTAFGVINLAEGKEIISVKYSDIKFIQNAKEFYVTVASENDKTKAGTMGILSAEGSTIISPSEFQDISILDAEEQLYLVQKGTKYGVVNRNGKPIIHPEYDEIGIDITDFKTDDIENSKLLFDKCIPVKEMNGSSSKFGLYNLDGEDVLQVNYDTLGYKNIEDKTSSSRENNTLLIPSSVGINGIVIGLEGLYGIFDVNEQRIILPCAYTKIYSLTKGGVTTYYVEYNGEQKELAGILKENNLVNITEDNKKENNSNIQENNAKDTNTSIEENTNTVTDVEKNVVAEE